VLWPAYYIIVYEPFHVHNKYINRWQVLYCGQRVAVDLFNDQTNDTHEGFYCFSLSMRRTGLHSNNKIACLRRKTTFFFFHFHPVSFLRAVLWWWLWHGISLALRHTLSNRHFGFLLRCFLSKPCNVINLRGRDADEYNVSSKQIQPYTYNSILCAVRPPIYNIQYTPCTHTCIIRFIIHFPWTLRVLIMLGDPDDWLYFFFLTSPPKLAVVNCT